MNTDNLWNYDEPCTDYFAAADMTANVPAWIDQDITPADVAAIIQGGCASGAYMPAVTYYTAKQTMAEHGDEVLEYIEDHLGELPSVEGGSWSGIAVLFLSTAVEIWAGSIADALLTALETIEGDDNADDD